MNRLSEPPYYGCSCGCVQHRKLLTLIYRCRMRNTRKRRVPGSISINTHGIIPHCKSMLAIRSVIPNSSSAAAPQPARSARVESCRPRSARIADKLMKDKPMELILLILLLVVLFGGGFGYYRGGYYRKGGPVGIGGILGLIVVVLAIGWLVHGHLGGLYL